MDENELPLLFANHERRGSLAAPHQTEYRPRSLQPGGQRPIALPQASRCLHTSCAGSPQNRLSDTAAHPRDGRPGSLSTLA